jgi:hypothetical protein
MFFFFPTKNQRLAQLSPLAHVNLPSEVQTRARASPAKNYPNNVNLSENFPLQKIPETTGEKTKNNKQIFQK